MKLLQQGNINLRIGRIAVLGTFDGVHRGHQFLLDFLLEQAQQRCLESLVITFAQHPLATIRPNDVPSLLLPLDERIARIESCKVESCLVLDFNQQLQQLTAREFLEMIGRDYGVKVLIIGFNTQFGKDRLKGIDQYRKIGEEVGIEILQAPEYGKGVCSSAVRRHLLNGNVTEANEALGYRFALCGKVVKGKQLGRTIGFPTANIETFVAKMLVPGNGVYVVDVVIPHLNDARYRGILNIGCRPTVDNLNAPISIEVNILDFEGDLYDTTLKVEFINFLRPECRFNSIEELTTQLHHDRKKAISINY